MSRGRAPNSHECGYFGRKLGNIVCDSIEMELDDDYLVIGSENDDQIYFGECLKDGEEMLKGRVLVYYFHCYSGDSYSTEDCYSFDLEDLIKWSCEHCTGIVERCLEDQRQKGLDPS